jgi:hypothetical protein
MSVAKTLAEKLANQSDKTKRTTGIYLPNVNLEKDFKIYFYV